MQDNTGRCPVCVAKLNRRSEAGSGDAKLYDCPYCGRYQLDGRLKLQLARDLKELPAKGPLISHHLRRMQERNDWPVLTDAVYTVLVDHGELPTPREQADNFIRCLGNRLEGPGDLISMLYEDHGSFVGAQNNDAFMFIVRGLKDQGLAEFGAQGARLTFKGWDKFQRLREGEASGQRVFMAMKFGDAELDDIVDNHFRGAVRQTGLPLHKLDDKPKAGLIDDRLRVEIKACRLLIADLTHANLGAYWEAGYAEGLGKPVIYTCKAAVFDEATTHFDTNHHLTIKWSTKDADEAAESLKATIRATLPDAKQQDELAEPDGQVP